MVKTHPKKAAAATALNRGAWTPEEDKKLVEYVRLHGDHNWRTLPEKAGLKRCGKSCRLRWLNYLRPSIKRGNITEDEEDLIIRLHNLLGNKWSLIAGRLPGRTDNEIKNYWNAHLSRRTLSTEDLNRKLFFNPNFSYQPLLVNHTVVTPSTLVRPLPIRFASRQKSLDRCTAPAATTTMHKNGITVPTSATLVAGWSSEISKMVQLSTPELIDAHEALDEMAQLINAHEAFDEMAQLLHWTDHTNRQTGTSDDGAIKAQEKDGGGALSSDELGVSLSAWEFDDLANIIGCEMGGELALWPLL